MHQLASQEHNNKKLIQYYHENFQYSQLKYQLALWVGNIISEQAIAPNTVGIYLDRAKKCVGNNLQTITVKLSLRIVSIQRILIVPVPACMPEPVFRSTKNSGMLP
jgi:hypothetical protein